MVLRKTAGTILQEVHGKNPDTTARILRKRPLVILHGILWKNPESPSPGPPEETAGNPSRDPLEESGIPITRPSGRGGAGYIFHPGDDPV
jgi:hypothetical protein